MARDIETGEIHDIDKQGQTDIDNQQIRVIGANAFKDDPLRMLRAVQFAARFDFKIESETMKQIKKNVKLINTVSADRFQEEFRKMFEKGTPSVGVDLLKETGILNQLFPRTVGHFPIEFNNLNKKSFPAFLAILLRGNYSKAIQKRFRLSNEDQQAIADVMKYTEMRDVDSDLGLVSFMKNVSKRGLENVEDILSITKKTSISNRLKAMKRAGKPTSMKELGIGGRDLAKAGFRGKEIGDALTYLLDYAVETGKNDKDHLLNTAKGKYGKS